MALEAWMKEIAREELKKLENQHPNRFGYLKIELEMFISDPKLESFFILPEPTSRCSTHSIPTQESSNRKRYSDCGTVHNQEFKRSKKRREERSVHVRMNNKAEVAIERAEACLERIRELKKSLIPPWLVS